MNARYMSWSTTRGVNFTFLMYGTGTFRYLTDGYAVIVHGTDGIFYRGIGIKIKSSAKGVLSFLFSTTILVYT